MKKIILGITTLITIQNAMAQQAFSGIRTGSHAGVHHLTNNPASIAGSERKWDINLLSFDVNASNNAIAFSWDMDQTKNTLANFVEKDLLNSQNISGALNIEILGPSFFFNINPKHAVGITSRFRTMEDVFDLNPSMLQSFLEDAQKIKNLPHKIQLDNQGLVANAFTEIGLSYGGVFFQTENHTVKVGATAKYVQGIFSYRVGINNFAGELSLSGNKQDVVLIGSGSVEVANGGLDFLEKTSISDFTQSHTSTIGFDFGVEYEFKKKAEDTRYLLRVGASVTDIGKLKYTATGKHSKQWTIPTNYYFNLSDIKESFDELDKISKGQSLNGIEMKSSLPTALRLNADVRIFRSIYVDFAGAFGLSKKDNEPYNAYYRNSLTITPRIENRYFGFYLPISNNSLSGTTLGAALRLGPLYIGSSTLLSNVLGNDSKSLNAFIGLRFGQ